MKTSYRERDYAYGAAMLQLRTEIGLTQDGLAKHLGVSRRAVGEWEAGSSYPKAEHLKEVIALAVKQQAWPSGREAEQIRALWKATRQKVLLDESWLASLLEPSRSPHLHLVPKTVEESRENRLVGEQSQDKGSVETKALPPVRLPTPLASGPRVDWGNALTVPIFYGREEELAQLSEWIVQEHCRVVSVLGMGGIGKSALVVSLMYKLSERFEVIIFRSLRAAPAFEALLDDCLQVFSPQSLVPAPLEQRLSLLLSHLRTARTLLVLDNLECLLEAGDIRGHFRPGFEGYGILFHRVVETLHQSCLLVTSREKPTDLRLLESRYPSMRTLRLSGLSVTACKQLLVEREVVGTEADQERLIEAYSHNPLDLKIVAETIVDLFGGEMSEFLGSGTLLFGSVTDLLDEQFARLSSLEKTVLVLCQSKID